MYVGELSSDTHYIDMYNILITRKPCQPVAISVLSQSSLYPPFHFKQILYIFQTVDVCDVWLFAPLCLSPLLLILLVIY